MSNALATLAALAILGLAAGCSSTSGMNTSGISNIETGAVKKTRATAVQSFIEVCHGFECTYRSKLQLSQGDARRFASIMASGKASPAAERAAVGRAVVYFEQRSAAMLGKKDTPMTQFANSRVRGEMDCIDESTNSRSLLKYLEARGLLKYHTVGRNLSRGFLIDNQFPHAAAALKDPKGVVWAIDSWPVPVGALPEIMPASKWRTEGDLGRELAAAMQ